MKTTWSKIKTLDRSRYTIVATEKKTATVKRPLPYRTGWDRTHFPNYLAGFENYYECKTFYGGAIWALKLEYWKNRPTYTQTIEFDLLDVEFTEEGKKEIQRRYELHKRNMEKYARLLSD